MQILHLTVHIKVNFEQQPIEVFIVGWATDQLGALFQSSRNVIWKFLHKNEEHRPASLAALQKQGFHHANMIERLVMKVENREIPPNVSPIATVRRKLVASLSIRTCSRKSWSATSLTIKRLFRNNTYRLSRTSWPNGSFKSKRRRRRNNNWNWPQWVLDNLSTYRG